MKIAEDQSEEEQIAEYERQLEELELKETKGFGYPIAPTKDSIYKFFRDILGMQDSSKVGNLSKEELGQLKLAVRNYIDIGKYAETEGLDDVADYLKNKAYTILDTSLSKEGFLSQLFVTQIKQEKKAKPEIIKKSWFGGIKKE